jgi:hypothetical protein
MHVRMATTTQKQVQNNVQRIISFQQIPDNNNINTLLDAFEHTHTDIRNDAMQLLQSSSVEENMDKLSPITRTQWVTDSLQMLTKSPTLQILTSCLKRLKDTALSADDATTPWFAK